MLRLIKYSCFAIALLSGAALADSTSYSPHATGFTLPNAQQAISATSAQTAGYATTAGSTGYATSAGTANTANFANSAASATNATNATNASYATTASSAATAGYATNSGVAGQAAELTAGNNCPAGTALSVTSGILGCVSSVTSITGQLNGAQIVGNLSVGSINAAGNIVSNGYTYGVGGLFTDNAVFSNTYVDRGGAGNAAFYGNASTSNAAASVTGPVNGAQIVGNLSVGSINATGNIVSNGYTYGIGGLFTDNAVFSNTYVDRNGGGGANFYGNALSANSATTAGYADSAGSTNYAANTNIGILYQNAGPNGGGGSTFYCAPGYHTVFYDTNVGSTNNAFFFQCVQDGY